MHDSQETNIPVTSLPREFGSSSHSPREPWLNHDPAARGIAGVLGYSINIDRLFHRVCGPILSSQYIDLLRLYSSSSIRLWVQRTKESKQAGCALTS